MLIKIKPCTGRSACIYRMKSERLNLNSLFRRFTFSWDTEWVRLSWGYIQWVKRYIYLLIYVSRWSENSLEQSLCTQRHQGPAARGWFDVRVTIQESPRQKIHRHEASGSFEAVFPSQVPRKSLAHFHVNIYAELVTCFSSRVVRFRVFCNGRDGSVMLWCSDLHHTDALVFLNRWSLRSYPDRDDEVACCLCKSMGYEGCHREPEKKDK